MLVTDKADELLLCELDRRGKVLEETNKNSHLQQKINNAAKHNLIFVSKKCN
jgi:hypothetical protein